MNEPRFCPACGGEVNTWHGDIVECPECGAMFDAEIFEEEE